MTRFVSLSLGALLMASVAVIGCGDDDPATECQTIKSELESSRQDCMGEAQMNECISCRDECDDECGTVNNACPVRFICPQ